MAVFEVALINRVPAVTGSPTLTTLDRLVVETISYTEELNRPGTASLGVPIRSMTSTVQTQLADLAASASEVWIYADSTLSWAGEIQTLNIQGQTVELGCVGLLGYLFRMGVTSDQTFTATDQFTIAKTLVDNWQALNYGNYGIDTSTVGTSGVTRDRTYLRNELHNVGQRITELGNVSDGFDLKVDPSTRKLVLTNSQQGSDLSASVFLDERNIDSAQVSVSVAPGDLVSHVDATGTSITTAGATSTLFSEQTTSALLSTYGRSWASANFDTVSVQGTLDNSANAFLAVRNKQLFQPGVTAFAGSNADVNGFHVGDTISYSYDAGLGRQTLSLRVGKLTVSVDSSGKQRLQVEFI